MADDKQLSQLISKSLRNPLSGDDARKLEQHLEQNEQSRKFAAISKVIQDSLVVGAERMVAGKEAEVNMPDAMRQRLKDSVSRAVQDRADGVASDDGLAEATDSDSVGSATVARDQTGEIREVASRFQLLRMIAKGGLGNVWLARDMKLNRTLAIKELHRESLESPQAWERFQREAEITGLLEHPNVVPIYQYGIDRQTGEPFYAMRFVGKRTLADAIIEHHDREKAGESTCMGLHRLLTVFLDVCQAIAYAHSRGVIHRDLKPENVALDNFGQVVVLDWGLAKVLEDGDLANHLTQPNELGDSVLNRTLQGDVVGTPLYMAPEQAAGDLDRIDNRTDVYGLGAILFSILTGTAPHANSVDESADELKDVLQAIADGESPDPASLNHKLPRDLARICQKAIARKPHLRFDSVEQLSEAVELWMAGQTTRQADYDNLRMEGRELRADMESAVRDLERNVRFMSALPPIQHLIAADSDQDVAVWRERLSQIFHGLLQANPDYRNVIYSQVKDDQFTELVRVERHSSDATTIRAVPRSRLRTEPISKHFQSLITRKPGEVLTSLVCDPLCEKDPGCAEEVGLAVGVPVYDDETEEVFGVVMIVCDMNQLLRKQMSRRSSGTEIVVACDIFHVMMHSRGGQIMEEHRGTRVADSVPHFMDAIKVLQNGSEFIDETNADIYGARLWLIPNRHGIMYLLRNTSPDP